MQSLMLAMTFLANWKFIFGLNIILLFIIKNNKNRWLLIASSLSDLVIIEPLKKIFAEPRPLRGLVTETSFAFPSGHSYTAVVVYGLLTYLLYKHFKNKTVIVLGTLVILLIAYSRIYLGVHYWWDVVAGIILGLVWLTAVLGVGKR